MYDAFRYITSLTSFLYSTLNRSCCVTYSSVAFMALGVYCSGLLLNFFPSQIDSNCQLSDTRICSLTEDTYADEAYD